MILDIDWNAMFDPNVALAEMFLRGTVMYLFIYFMLRVSRRQAGSIGIADLLVVVLVADASQNAMASDYRSITEGAVLVGSIFFWDYTFDWLGDRYHDTWLGRILRPSPLPLIRNGRIDWRNLRREMITEDELMGQLRQQGVERIEEVKESFLEVDGHISVVKREG